MTENPGTGKDDNVNAIQMNTTRTEIGNAQAPILSGIFKGPVNTWR